MNLEKLHGLAVAWETRRVHGPPVQASSETVSRIIFDNLPGRRRLRGDGDHNKKTAKGRFILIDVGFGD